MSVYRYLIIFAAFLGFVFLPQNVFAETTPYRSAGWVGTQTWLANYYQNLTGCQVTDGIYCERPSAPGGMNLYFSSFGTLSDFGIPQGSTINSIHIKITGKNSVIQWVQVGQGRNKPLGSLCQNQNKFDMWKVYLGATDSVWETHTPFTPFSTGGNGLSNCFSANTINAQNFTIALFFNGYYIDQWYAYIDNFEIAFDYTPPPSPTPTPTLTPTPTPTAVPTPEPFLDLPWNYSKTGKSFEDIVFDPNSWFDHEYPLQNNPCCIKGIKIYTGKYKAELFYKSHSGYDYGLRHNVRLNTPVIAAASGFATFIPEAKSGGGGNTIKIDHDNGYQTWYMHLRDDGLVVDTEGQKVYVEKGEEIGKTGFTGNAYPKDERGAHIHFSVFKDTNENGTFDDDYPFGLVDPLGWEPDKSLVDKIDPWTLYGTGGAISYNLFLKRAQPKTATIPVSGSTLITDDQKLQAIFPAGSYFSNLFIEQRYGPFESFISDGKSFVSAAPAFFLEAKDGLGSTVTQFYQPIQIIYKYSVFDQLRYKENTLLLYYFNELSQEWEPLPSVVDTVNHIVTAETMHFTQFALMGEERDTIPPTTDIVINGDKGQDNWYRSAVSVDLQGQDNEDGVGVAYILYQVNDEEWEEYVTPLLIDSEGEHTIRYFSMDQAENKEEMHVVTIFIDRTAPDVTIDATPSTLWPPNGNMVDILITGSSTDDNLMATTFEVNDEYDLVEPEITNFDEVIQIQAKRYGYDKDGRMYEIIVTATDKAGNQNNASTTIIVNHDKGQ